MDNEPNLKKNVKSPFGWVPNNIIYDPNLSLKAKGLWLYMHAKPGDWHFAADRIAKETLDGRESIQAGLRELVEAGYLLAKKQGNGRFLYILCEKGNRQQGSNRGEKPVENPKSGNPVLGTDPKSGNPTEGKPHGGETRPVINKEKNKKRDIIKKEWGDDILKLVENSTAGLAGKSPAGSDDRPKRKDFDSQEDFVRAIYDWNTKTSVSINY